MNMMKRLLAMLLMLCMLLPLCVWAEEETAAVRVRATRAMAARVRVVPATRVAAAALAVTLRHSTAPTTQASARPAETSAASTTCLIHSRQPRMIFHSKEGESTNHGKKCKA